MAAWFPNDDDLFECGVVQPATVQCRRCLESLFIQYELLVKHTFSFPFVNNSRGASGLSLPNKTGMLLRFLANVSTSSLSLDSSLPPQPAKCQVTLDENGLKLGRHRLGRKAEM